jgi:PKD repeat protein
MRFVLFLLGVILAAQFCRPLHASTVTAPSAAFTISPNPALVAQSVKFTDTSTGNPTAWSWTFGDGTASTSRNPSHAFASAGTFTVTLTASNSAGAGSAHNSVTVTVAPPKAAFKYSPSSPNTTQTIAFTDTSTGTPTFWSWTFGDGSTSTLQNPTHRYSAAGTYTVVLMAGNAGGNSSASKSITVVAILPTAAFGFSPSVVAINQTVTFTDHSGGNPTSWSWNFGDGTTSTLQNPTHVYSTAATVTVTLTVTNAGGSNSTSQSIAVQATSYSMALTLSDGAQLTSIAFSGLAMVDGNLWSQSFFPPGTYSDYFGFQFLRDNDPDNQGHNTSFLTRVAYNVIYTLNDSQFAQLVALANTQQSEINNYGYERFALMEAFRRQLTGDIPSGSTGLNHDAVAQASEALYAIDGQIAFEQAGVYASILNSLTSTQLAYVNSMVGKGYNEWPNIPFSAVQARLSGLSSDAETAVMTYASSIFSWYAGSLTADSYFCPERHGTYYGSFYLKDYPGMGQPNYNMNEQLTNTAGQALSNSSAGYVTAAQAAVMQNVLNLQRNNLYAGATNIVQVRTQIATLLLGLLTSPESGSTIQSQVLALSQTYGQLDGQNNYYYATTFAQIYGSLTATESTKLTGIWNSILIGTYADGTPFNDSNCTTPFLYQDVITDPSVLEPYIGNTDYLFFEP